jgi:hypothetical protein
MAKTVNAGFHRGRADVSGWLKGKSGFLVALAQMLFGGDTLRHRDAASECPAILFMPTSLDRQMLELGESLCLVIAAGSLVV